MTFNSIQDQLEVVAVLVAPAVLAFNSIQDQRISSRNSTSDRFRFLSILSKINAEYQYPYLRETLVNFQFYPRSTAFCNFNTVLPCNFQFYPRSTKETDTVLLRCGSENFQFYPRSTSFNLACM